MTLTLGCIRPQVPRIGRFGDFSGAEAKAKLPPSSCRAQRSTSYNEEHLDRYSWHSVFLTLHRCISFEHSLFRFLNFCFTFTKKKYQLILFFTSQARKVDDQVLLSFLPSSLCLFRLSLGVFLSFLTNEMDEQVTASRSMPSRGRHVEYPHHRQFAQLLTGESSTRV